MDGVKDMMLTGADQFTKALCVAQGKQLMEVEYLSNVNKKQK